MPGGRLNAAQRYATFAAGYRAQANHHGTFVWADSTDANFTSTGEDQFLIRASGGVGIGTASPDAMLHIGTGGSNWTTNDWAKGLTIENAIAVKYGRGGTTMFGLGVTANTLYHWFTNTETATGDAANYYMVVNDSGQVGIGDVPNTSFEFHVTGAAGGTTTWTTSLRRSC